jgi:RHS repeat-associated protein
LYSWKWKGFELALGRRRREQPEMWVATPDLPRSPDHVFYRTLNSLLKEAHVDRTLEDLCRPYYADEIGRPGTLTKDKGNDASIDEAITYSYDANDRLTDELLDLGNNATTDQTTTYGWGHTQQASKIVVENATGHTTSRQTFGYDLQGRMAEVVLETYANNTVTQRERVTYNYDATGIRVSSEHYNDANLDGTFASAEKINTTEFLVDHHNFTGYQQVLKETTYDSQGNMVKTVEYTFGHDEIAQTITERDGQGNVISEAVHVFGHDGHGSVRALFDMAAAIAHLYAFEAYGQLLSIHNGAAQFVSNNPAQALTTILQNGEQFDSRINKLWLRARWYDPQTGRFMRLDDFFGVPRDPQSLHKYLFVHGDSVNGIDPTGLFNAVSTIGQIGIALNLVSAGIHGGQLVDAVLRRDNEAANEAFFWLALDLLFLAIPFSGPGSGFLRAAGAHGGTVKTFVYSPIGLRLSAAWGYSIFPAHLLASSNISFALSGLFGDDSSTAGGRVIRRDQYNDSAINPGDILTDSSNIHNVIGDSLEARGTVGTDVWKSLFRFLRFDSPAGFQALTKDPLGRLHVVARNFNASSGDVIARVDINGIPSNQVYDLTDPVILNELIKRYPDKSQFWRKLSAEGVVAIQGDIPSSTVTALGRPPAGASANDVTDFLDTFYSIP